MATVNHASPDPAMPPPLRPWVARLWVAHTPAAPQAQREHVLPTGLMHLVVRLSGPPLRLLNEGAASGAPTELRGPVVGGVRERYYAKEHAGPVLSIGAVLRPGATRALFGVGAAELATRHTALSDLCGADAERLQQQLEEADGPQRQLAVLAGWLAQRSRNAAPVADMVLDALDTLSRPARIDQLVRASRFSHRAFIARFRDAAGMGPKRYARLMRFRQLLEDLHRQPTRTLADLALDHGYSDQAHMAREFRAMAGTTPTAYRALAPVHAHHMPLPPAR